MTGTPFKVKALYDYSSPHDDDLDFSLGQIITVTDVEDDDWYSGEFTDEGGKKHEGIFPKNFVERLEPEAPPRPTRTNRSRKEVEPAVSSLEPDANPETKPAILREAEPTAAAKSTQVSAPPEPNVAEPVEEPREPVRPDGALSGPDDSATIQPDPPASQPASKSGPSQSRGPPVAVKPSSGSFRDRIAAFNKPAAAPITPFKPGALGGGGSGFIKKPFIAPPPSRDAYVPPPREAPVRKVYRREEDPEIIGRTSEDADNEEQKSAAAPDPNDDADDDQPKPTSLKERIALLQRQQAEQAARHAEAAQKKDKPKRPQKPRIESSAPVERDNESDGPDPEVHDDGEAAGKRAGEGPREDRSAKAKGNAELARETQPSHASLGARDVQSDANDADQSGAGETTEDAETSTGVDDSDHKPASRQPSLPIRPAAGPPRHEPDVGDEEDEAEEDATRPEAEDEEGGDEEDDIDPEARRRMEIRERMAKMSGGMGMHGMFGPPGAMPMPMPGGVKKSKGSGSSAKFSTGDDDAPSAVHAPPVPIMALPGMSPGRPRDRSDRAPTSKDDDGNRQGRTSLSQEPDQIEDLEDNSATPIPPMRPSKLEEAPAAASEPPVVPDLSAPTVPGARAAPPPPTSRPVPPPPPSQAKDIGTGTDSDDELPGDARELSMDTSATDTPGPLSQPPTPSAPGGGAPPIPGRPVASPPRPPQRSHAQHAATTVETTAEAVGENTLGQRMGPPARHPPPPPPPTASAPAPALSRKSTGDARPVRQTKPAVPDESEEEVTEYEGDYDTDIASGATHKDALKAHAREPSGDDSTIVDEPSPAKAPAGPPPMPPMAAPRAAPPPLPPSQPPRASRSSVEMPRAAPPPLPPPKAPLSEHDDDEYDPYRYSAPTRSVPVPDLSMVSTITAPPPGRYEDDDPASGPSAGIPPPAPRHPPPPRQVAPSSPSRETAASLAPQPPAHAPPRASADTPRSPMASRRSMEQGRPSSDYGHIAADVDLGQGSQWWTQPHTPPPAFQNRRDILYEIEESSTSKRGGKTSISRDVYVLFVDYSQTVITAQFDAKQPADVVLEQRHEPPPQRLRQDQLEAAHERFGQRIAAEATAKQNGTVGDGTPQALIYELLRPLPDALLPVGGRAYGAIVYANLANASVQQHDEIRAGDIMTIRNGKFQGHRGTMHQKYNVEVGKPDHVAVVVDWDGTKKKVRVWEQGRESKKVKVESFKLGDLRSGEVKIWRVMARSWVGWEGQN